MNSYRGLTCRNNRRVLERLRIKVHNNRAVVKVAQVIEVGVIVGKLKLLQTEIIFLLSCSSLDNESVIACRRTTLIYYGKVNVLLAVVVLHKGDRHREELICACEHLN